MYDPYGAPLTFFRSVGDEITGAGPGGHGADGCPALSTTPVAGVAGVPRAPDRPELVGAHPRHRHAPRSGRAVTPAKERRPAPPDPELAECCSASRPGSAPSSSLPPRTSSPPPCWPRSARRSPTSTPRVTRTPTTAAAEVDLAERLAVSGPGPCSAPSTPTCSRTWALAVLAAYAALLRPGDTVLAMALPYGGHLTHGSPANFSGRWFDFVGYGVDAETGLIDYDRCAPGPGAPAQAIVCGASAYPRPPISLLREIADEVGAYLMADAAHPIGLVAARRPRRSRSRTSSRDHARGAARSARRADLVRGGARRADRPGGVPVHPGRPAMHTIAAKAVALGEAATRVRRGRPQVVANARVLAAGVWRRALWP